jgi:glutamyl-Q tRNA(Asp) synthetase
MLGFDLAMEQGGEWLLRIEDIDGQRSKPEWEQAIYDDLEWLGLWWPDPVMRQSDRSDAYADALRRLNWPTPLLFPCDCSRADIAAALDAPQNGVSHPVGADGLVYPGTCKAKDAPTLAWADDPTDRLALKQIGEGIENTPEVHHFYDRLDAGPPLDLSTSLRLHMDRASRLVAGRRPGEAAELTFQEAGHGPGGEHGLVRFTPEDMARHVGDVVLARRGMGTSYHLSVVLDDAAQGITHVVRGEDLFEATKIHVVLQRLLNLPTPTYHHHRLIRDESGRRLAKREDAKAIRRFREEGATPRDIRRMVGLDPDRGP